MWVSIECTFLAISSLFVGCGMLFFSYQMDNRMKRKHSCCDDLCTFCNYSSTKQLIAAALQQNCCHSNLPIWQSHAPLTELSQTVWVWLGARALDAFQVHSTQTLIGQYTHTWCKWTNVWGVGAHMGFAFLKLTVLHNIFIASARWLHCRMLRIYIPATLFQYACLRWVCDHTLFHEMMYLNYFMLESDELRIQFTKF